MRIHSTFVTAIVIGCATELCQADIAGFFDRDKWEAAVGDFTTITFTEFPQGTVVTDHYAPLGVEFTDGNDWILHSSSFVNDGTGLVGSSDMHVTVEFNAPQLWFGVDHPGTAAIDAFFEGELIGTFENLGGVFGAFTGILSDTLFDEVVVYRPTGNEPFIDDMHWGVPTPGALAVLGLAGLLTHSRTQRR